MAPSAGRAKSGIEAKDDSRCFNLAGVHDVIGIAVGRRDAGVVFKGDRRFQIVVRLSDTERDNIEVLKNLPVGLPESTPGGGATMVPLRQFASFRFSEGPTKLAETTASAGSS